jgi:hypothetical protein
MMKKPTVGDKVNEERAKKFKTWKKEFVITEKLLKKSYNKKKLI